MIDIHTHILPEMDDGAKDRDEAIALISLLKKQGVSLAVLTPHYYPFEESLPDFLERRRLSYQSIEDCGFNMILGSETYLSESLFSYDSIDELKIANTGYLLLELPYMEKWSNGFFRQINRIKSKYNIRPIIAHAERCKPVKEKKERALQDLIDLGCLIQIDIGSVVNKETRSSALRLLQGGWVDFVGSDCHNRTERPPQFDLFKEIAGKKLKNEYAKLESQRLV
jgi:Capsular polysaccharide biosynthesis protein